jgi:hypothetical protein
MAHASEEEMRELGKATGSAISRAEALGMINGLLQTIRELRLENSSAQEEKAVFALKAAIEGIRETMPRE